MIEQNYNQIWHGINANIKHSCKLQLYNDLLGEKKKMIGIFYLILFFLRI